MPGSKDWKKRPRAATGQGRSEGGRRRRVIVVTDGDRTAWHAVREAAQRLGLATLPESVGNPTPLDGPEMVRAVREAPRDPVVVLVDDRGDEAEGRGEKTLRYLLQSEAVEVMGAVAVASNTRPVAGVHPAYSVNREAHLVPGAVDKQGRKAGDVLKGDTVDVLRASGVPVVGLGDPGKMDGHDSPRHGAPATEAALRTILEGRHGDT
jgi:stage V sporulation protein AE